MNKLRSSFPKQYSFLPVIHVVNESQALTNALLAEGEGADGVFLINHQIPAAELLHCYDKVRERLPNFWIGLNFLDLSPEHALEIIPKTVSGLWSDNAGIDEAAADPTAQAKSFKEFRVAINWPGVYFGGVAFKYQTPVKNLTKVTSLALPLVDVITTSGPGTGLEASLVKIKRMKEAARSHPIALASGVTPENVYCYLPYVDCFLVATGISDSHTQLNRFRVSKLARALKK